MTVLVTGATGFIGSRVVLNLGKRNLRIVVADLDLGQNKSNLENKYFNLGFEKKLLTFEKIEINRNKLKKLVEAAEILRKKY